MIYFIVLFCVMFLLIQYDVLKEKRGFIFFYIVTLLAFVLLAGLRYRVGLDSIHYYYIHQTMPEWSELSTFDFSASRYGFLWIVFSAFCKLFSNDYYFLQFIHALIINCIYFVFIYKFTKYRFTALFLYFILGFLYFNTEILRESLAVAVFLFAIPAFYKKKWIQYYIIAMISILIHSSAIVVFLFPLVYRIKLNKYFIISLVGGFLVCIVLWHNLDAFIGKLFFISDIEGQVYAYIERGYNLRGIVFALLRHVVMPVVFIAYARKNNFIINHVPFLWLYILFGIFSVFNAVIFERFQNYIFFLFILFLVDFFAQLYKQKHQIRMAKILFFFFILIAPTVFQYLRSEHMPGSRFYQRYFPYRSILNKQRSEERERLPHFFWHYR